MDPNIQRVAQAMMPAQTANGPVFGGPMGGGGSPPPQGLDGAPMFHMQAQALPNTMPAPMSAPTPSAMPQFTPTPPRVLPPVHPPGSDNPSGLNYYSVMDHGGSPLFQSSQAPSGAYQVGGDVFGSDGGWLGPAGGATGQQIPLDQGYRQGMLTAPDQRYQQYQPPVPNPWAGAD